MKAIALFLIIVQLSFSALAQGVKEAATPCDAAIAKYTKANEARAQISIRLARSTAVEPITNNGLFISGDNLLSHYKDKLGDLFSAMAKAFSQSKQPLTTDDLLTDFERLKAM